MKEVMKHLGDGELQLQLVRYHNTQAWDKLRDMAAYIQMLLARIEKGDSKRVLAQEVEVLQCDAGSVAEHLRNAELFAHSIAADKSQAVIDQTITETESIAGGVTSMGIVKKNKEAQ